MTLSAGKTYGPKQVGALYVRAGIQLTPLLNGGGQEFGLRSGTENIAGAVGFAKALELATKRRSAEVERLQKLQERMIKELSEITGVVIHGHTSRRLPNNICFSLPHIDGETAVMELDEVGVQAATGSACGASKDGPSHVLLALGVSPTVAENSVRLTMGRSTEEADIIKVLAEIKRLAAKG
jgi:cysteine desulfurase